VFRDIVAQKKKKDNLKEKDFAAEIIVAKQQTKLKTKQQDLIVRE